MLAPVMFYCSTWNSVKQGSDVLEQKKMGSGEGSLRCRGSPAKRLLLLYGPRELAGVE